MGEITEVCRRFLSKNAFFKEVCSFWNFLNRTWMKVELNGGITGGARKEEVGRLEASPFCIGWRG